MARTAESFADALYVTSDNPRTEDPRAILDEVVSGLSAVGRAKAVIEIDRRTAIRRALADAQEGDVVLIAGKGHENYQILGTTKHHFDDVEEATAAIKGSPLAA
jgi:UDP-N-acetylmuramoyl-L-alanyl-D-glutamate--2,6-diaminopimelate ligase